MVQTLNKASETIYLQPFHLDKHSVECLETSTVILILDYIFASQHIQLV